MHPYLLGNGEQQGPEQHDGRDALQHATEDHEGHDGDGQEHRHAAGQSGHEISQRGGETRLGQRPRHPGRGPDDEEDRA